MATAAPGPQDLESSIQKPGKEADSQHSDAEAKMAAEEQSSVATKKSNSVTVKKESDADQQQRLLVKLKHNDDKTSSSASEDQLLAPTSSDDLTQRLSLGEASDAIVLKIPVKQEPRQDGEALHQKSDSDGSRTERGNGRDGHVSNFQPLDEYMQGEARAETFRHGSEAEAPQRVDRPDSAQQGSSGGDDGQDNIVMPISDDRGSSRQSSLARLDSGKDLREVPRPGRTGAPRGDHDKRVMMQGIAISDFENAKFNVASGTAVPLSQHHQAFTNKSASPHLSSQHGATQSLIPSGFQNYGSPTPRHGSQQPIAQHKQPYLTPDLERQQQLRAQIEEKKRQLENARRLHEDSQRQARRVSSSYGFAQSLSGTPPFPMGPFGYPRPPQSEHQQPASGYNNANYQFQMQAPMHYGGMGPSLSPAPPLTPGYNLQSHRPLAPGTNRRFPGPYAPSASPGPHGQEVSYHDSEDEEASDDDEPLRTRVKRHPSITSQDSVASASSPTRPSAGSGQRKESSAIDFLSSNTKTKAGIVNNPIRLARPLPQPGPSSPPSNNNNSTDDPTAIDWKLPRFDLQRQPPEKNSDIPVVKISLPNLVREELLLSPDHSAQEIHLLLHVFLPSQRALAIPDPAPAAAVLNFHTIALMVVEAFVQYEIGDELGTGRGHWHESHDQGGEEYVKVRSAKDANVDEIFWAVVDRWRAGVESRKKSLEVIRGCQEFCDVALDVIYWVKEHGLLGEEEEEGKGEKEQGVKGKKRERAASAAEKKGGDGDGGGEDEAPEGVSRGKFPAKSKRGTADRPNHVQPRKKAKTQAKEGKKKMGTPRTPGVTITRRPR
ncbi:hypothetical protein DDE82_005018 [Stemphylium lycopersici]|uniref:Uncharacterized protein n=1 Tax=Stemphylium lycopersici TaxID=183478 RepID=A0A364NFN7_STELY|nr:hypothetical protein TW65_07158 [Stemphylium lycopersici]RAR03722.1 hypothetical protein DDE82_005018 [Stemphylium lycopersici]RAR16109.1 hypothetical protein DDE83_000466 [Stemphylium lycopersici]